MTVSELLNKGRELLADIENGSNEARWIFEEVFENPVTKNRNPKGYRSLARLQGFIAHVCYKLNIPYEIKEENSWITAWGTYSSKIKREERKKDILVKVNEYYNLNLTRDDLSDAIGLGRYAVENYKK